MRHLQDVNEFLATLPLSPSARKARSPRELSRKYAQLPRMAAGHGGMPGLLRAGRPEEERLIAAQLSDINARGPSVGVT